MHHLLSINIALWKSIGLRVIHMFIVVNGYTDNR